MLGEMAELGEGAPHFHHDVAEYARRLDIELIPIATDLYGGAQISLDTATDRVLHMNVDDVVLIKASRAFGLDRIVRAVTATTEKA